MVLDWGRQGWSVLLMFCFLLWPEATEKIPELYEQWISTRNVGKIKATMLAKEVHAEVCGGQDAMNAALGSFDVLFSEFATLSLLQASSVSKLRGIQSNLKLIRSYSVAVHGINLILNRMANKAARERAALVRELLGSIGSLQGNLWQSYGVG